MIHEEHITPIAAAAATNNADKKVIFQNSVPFTGCINKKDDTQVDNTKNIDVVILMYNLIEYNDNYSKTSWSLWQYYRHETALNAAGGIANFPDDNSGASFKFKQVITGQTGNDGTKDVEIIIPLKYLSNFLRTLEVPFSNYEINAILTWSANCFIRANAIDGQIPKCAIADTKLYNPAVTLSTQDNVKLLGQLKSGFKITINWNKYHSKATYRHEANT